MDVKTLGAVHTHTHTSELVKVIRGKNTFISDE